MSTTQVTITLGSSGQRVVKHSSRYDDGSSSRQRLSGRKRSLAEPFVSNANGYSLTKRVKGGASTQGSRYTGPADARIGKNDLRLRLLRKRMSKQIVENEERKKKEMQAKMSGISQSTHQYERSRLTNAPLPRRVPLELAASSYASQASNGLRPRSPRNINEFQHVPLTRPADATRTVALLGSDPVNPSRSIGPAPAMLGVARGISFSNGSVPSISYPDQEPVTVTGLLNALGLGKYAIHFQAEEVDMAALKQMGDRDLKELGIPMGPRKKILLAIMAYNKRPKPT